MKNNKTVIKKAIIKTGFKFYEAMNTIKLGGTALDKIFVDAWSKLESVAKNEPNLVLAAQGKYYPKEHIGYAWNWQPKKSKAN